MNIFLSREKIYRFEKKLKKVSSNPHTEIVMIFEYLLKMDKNEILYMIEKGISLSFKSYIKLIYFINKRIKGYPLQYLLGYTFFYDEKFIVNPDVLIPRKDTEFLVQKTIEICKEIYNKKKQRLHIIDIGTGSGIIVITIKRVLNKKVNCIGSDISNKALKVAKANAQKILGKFNDILFIKSDLFKNIDKDHKFDLIVSNPPYISKFEFDKLSKEIKKFEPKIALLSKDNGKYFYKKILFYSKKYLKKGGYVIFETGTEKLSYEVFELFHESGFNEIEFITDFTGFKLGVYGRFYDFE